MRAMGLDPARPEFESLDAIGADLGVSRETVRRARNELVNNLDKSDLAGSSELPPLRTSSADSPATARALRRLLTMTGPLRWDEIVSAWARAGGRAPYVSLPTSVESARQWVDSSSGLVVIPPAHEGVPFTLGVERPEGLDQVSEFLFETMRDRPGGIERAALLHAAEAAGLKASTVATSLSLHPAVTRLGRGMWMLRGRRRIDRADRVAVAKSSRAQRVRPTSFSWDADGALVLEFSPRGPSPVIAVPSAVATLVEGRQFVLDDRDNHVVKIRNSRLWGFGPLVSQIGLNGGQRGRLELNLIAGTAHFTAADKDKKESMHE